MRSVLIIRLWDLSQLCYPQNYAATAEYAKRRNILYDNQLEIF